MTRKRPKRHTPHDLSLPDWGPYSKSHLGISHVADPAAGLRMDLVPSPGFYRGRLCIPSALWDSGARPIEALPDLSRYTLRHEIDGRERVFADITYSLVNPHTTGIRAHFVNRSPQRAVCTLNCFAILRFPNEFVRDATPLRPAIPAIPASAVLVRAIDYEALELADRRAATGIVSDARRRGEIRESGFSGGVGLGRPFGGRGDRARWNITMPESLPSGTCVVRYRAGGRVTARIAFVAGAPGSGHACTVDLPAADELRTHAFEVGAIERGAIAVSLEIISGDGLELDALVLLPEDERESVSFPAPLPIARPDLEVITAGGTREPAELWWARPIEEKSGARGVVIDYPEIGGAYLLQWNYGYGRVRAVHNGEIDTFMRTLVHEHVKDELPGDRLGHFTSAAIEPVAVEPGGTVDIEMRMLLCDRRTIERSIGETAAALEELRRPAAQSTDSGAATAISERSPSGDSRPPGAEAHDDTSPESVHRPGRDLLAATLLTNIAYPIHTKRGYIRHNTPGRWWDSLYTWDSGFVGIGLSELDVSRASDCLLAYLTELDDPDAPYVQHGTPLPVQIYLFRELWNRYHDTELERYAYPRLKRMYDFLVGRTEGSPTQPFASGLVTTWEIFYNSGGWDDYPPQVYVHRNELTGSVAPVVSTAHAIRAARILAGHAGRLGIEADLADFRDDIARLEYALREYSWDEESGCFGYVTHDTGGRPTGVLRHESGTNFNLGLDGVSPVVSGSCDRRQIERLVGMIMSPERMWTDIGVSTVDRSAPYYRDDGYWNGVVWMPHQWFIWKALIDYGYIDEALRIATTALDLWSRETAESRNCYEHFLIAGGRGAGWHQFGGLSAPILNWYGALYAEGRVTPGFDVRLDSHTHDPGAGSVDFRAINESNEERWMLVSLSGAENKTMDSTGSAQLRSEAVHENMLAVAVPAATSAEIRVGG